MERSLLDDVKIMASEVVTNSVHHSGRPHGDPISLTANVSGGVLRVEVIDQGSGTHPLEPRSTTPPSGLKMVAILSDRWSSRRDHSFHVSFEIDVTARTVFSRTASA
jgi:hypothetical protein